ncbi:hypothetical protein [Hymenobacter sp. IS2118]|uniref:hypothetical protein n=1 Tax=Hymenobacter sp. IS2118 TaxID=1505605 RepID=UPI00055329F5|nr:hypothetical protein [Hymenobacter sp. IS2118]
MIYKDKPAEFSPAEITDFESKNPSREKVEVFRYESKRSKDRPATFYVAKPNRLQIEAIEETRERSRGNGNDLMINTGVLAGDVDQLDEDDALYFGLLRDVTNLIEAKKKL